MEITVNGEGKTVPEGYTAAQLVTDLGLGEGRMAMEVNLEIVPRTRYPEHVLRDGDRVEVVHAIGGG